jgi:hypothetical protein
MYIYRLLSEKYAMERENLSLSEERERYQNLLEATREDAKNSVKISKIQAESSLV